MPIIASFMPFWALRLTIASNIGIKASPPSKENRFCPTYLKPKYFSKPSATTNRSKIRFFSSLVGLKFAQPFSMRSRIHSTSSVRLICMYSKPIVLQ